MHACVHAHSLSCVPLSVTPETAPCHGPLSMGLLLLFSSPVMSDSLQPHGLFTPGLSVLHHLPKFAQVHVHCISDAIQPFHPLIPSSPSVINLSRASGAFPMSQLFTSGDQNTGASDSASVLPMSIQG